MDKNTDKSIIYKELKGCFDFFYNEHSIGEFFGLTRDRTNNPDCSSIASTGYAFCAYVIGVKNGFIGFDEGYTFCEKTLDTFLKLDTVHGFFYHFINIKTGKKYYNDVSVIDTAILVCGMLAAGEFFGGNVKQMAEKIFAGVEWNWYFDKNVNMFYMGYDENRGFSGHWDWYAEQLMLYVLSTASDNYPVDKCAYYNFKRNFNSYDNIKDICYSYHGALFTYQFSHAFINFKGKKDSLGMDWFENSVKATMASRLYSIDNPLNHKGYGDLMWGLTACDYDKGYQSYGALPAKENFDDGTVAPCGAIGSIIFLPDEVIKTMNNYSKYDKLWGKYGFYDSFNLNINFFAKSYVGIDKGISLVMLQNYIDGTIWNLLEKNKFIKKGLKILNIK